jgi:hypothetical protein
MKLMEGSGYALFKVLAYFGRMKKTMKYIRLVGPEI